MFFSKNSGVSWLVAFLGNPGREYENTRHNAGFMAAEALEAAEGCKINRLRFRALTGTLDVGGERVLLMKPQTFMNLSGEAVGAAAKFYKLPPERCIVVSDEMAIPVGRIRVRSSGSAGGHNGLKSVIAHLGSDMFPRIRIGIGEPPREEYDPKDWVLSRFSGHDGEDIKKASRAAAEAAVCYIKEGLDKTMTRYNGQLK